MCISLRILYIYHIYIFHYMTNNVALQVRHSARLQQTQYKPTPNDTRPHSPLSSESCPQSC